MKGISLRTASNSSRKVSAPMVVDASSSMKNVASLNSTLTSMFPKCSTSNRGIPMMRIQLWVLCGISSLRLVMIKDLRSSLEIVTKTMNHWWSSQDAQAIHQTPSLRTVMTQNLQFPFLEWNLRADLSRYHLNKTLKTHIIHQTLKYTKDSSLKKILNLTLVILLNDL